MYKNEGFDKHKSTTMKAVNPKRCNYNILNVEDIHI